jgi:hypothetical protein
MAVAVVFTPPSMTAAHYDSVIEGLKKAGEYPPPGLISHVCFGSGDQLRVVDVWESEGSFKAFAERLVPNIPRVLGADVAEPEFGPVHALLVL